MPLPATPIIFSGVLLLPDGEASSRLAPGTVIVEEGRIADLSVGSFHPRPDFGGEDCLICPGFVDTHLHLPQFDSIGIDGLELLDWLHTVVFPAELKWADADYAAAMTARVAHELHSFGTTAVAAYATSHAEAAQTAINVLGTAGMAGYVGQVLMDQHAPAGLLVPAPAALSQASSLRGAGRVMPAITPRFAVACSARLLEGAGQLAARTGWLIQTHLSETRRECEVVAELHGAPNYTEVYKRAGLLTPRTVLGHGIWLDAGERATLRECGALVAHCPAANQFLDAGVMNRAATVGAGVRVSLGTDIGAGPDRSMVRVARGAIDAAKQTGAGSVPTAAECWHLITAGNAKAIGLARSGALARGQDADLLVVRPTGRWRESADPLSTLLYTWDDRWLRATVAAGRLVFGEGAGP